VTAAVLPQPFDAAGRRASRWTRVVILAVLAVATVRSVAVLAREGEVASAEARLDSAPATNASGRVTPLIAIPWHEGGYPARARVADALALARQAQASPDPSARHEMTERAAVEIEAALARRPEWGEGWTVAAFIDELRYGDNNPTAIAALARSYRGAPYLRDAAGWRVRFGLTAWSSLDAATQAKVIDEAVWLVRIDSTTAGPVFDLARQSPAYPQLMLRWLAMRPGDANFITDRATP
jgi:hypothetical protein